MCQCIDTLFYRNFVAEYKTEENHSSPPFLYLYHKIYLSLHYMNKILERWHKAGITTPKQAALEAGEKAAKEQEKHKPTYDLEEYEKIDLSEFM